MRYYVLNDEGWVLESAARPQPGRVFQNLPEQPSEWHRWDGTQWTEDTSPELMEKLRAEKAAEIKAHGLSLIQSRIPALDSYEMVAFMRVLWPTLTDPASQPDLAYARDVYLYTVDRLADLETATREQIEGYVPEEDPNWP